MVEKVVRHRVQLWSSVDHVPTPQNKNHPDAELSILNMRQHSSFLNIEEPCPKKSNETEKSSFGFVKYEEYASSHIDDEYKFETLYIMAFYQNRSQKQNPVFHEQETQEALLFTL